ncbi:MAG: hypothetical protein ACYDHN_11295 [Solirubrobacteraceae bacterium]
MLLVVVTLRVLYSHGVTAFEKSHTLTQPDIAIPAAIPAAITTAVTVTVT